MRLRIRPVLIAASASLFLISCTMDVALPTREPSVSGQPAGITFQRMSSAPRQSVKDIQEADLKPGDLLLSSTIGLTSVGIRLFSTSAVSHVAIYIGEGEVAEAVGSGVQIVTLQEAMDHSNKLFALRMPTLTEEQAKTIRAFSQQKIGSRYNYRGIIEMAPFMVTKQLCSLNPFSKEFRRQCVQGMAAAQLSTPTGEEASSYFCSQFVIAAFEHAGNPLTVASAGWVSPSDLLHMREGDIATLAPNTELDYVGHIKPGIYLNARRLIGI